jgi:DNA-binding transcriptional ArsR family regulator
MSRGHSRLAAARQVHHHALIFAALGDERRLTLLLRLCDAHPRSIAQLTKGSRITRQAITKHLRVLEKAGLVRAEIAGRECRYKFKPQALDDAHDYLGRVSMQWEQALGRLKAFVEKEKDQVKLRN